MFLGVFWNQPVCPSMCLSVYLSVYKILVSVKAGGGINLFLHSRLNTLRKKLWENIVGKREIAQMSNFTFFHNVFYAICILKFFNSHISVVVWNFFELGTVSKQCIREWVKSHLVTALVVNGLYSCCMISTSEQKCWMNQKIRIESFIVGKPVLLDMSYPSKIKM